MKWFRFFRSNPGRDLAMIRVECDRARIRAVARQMRHEAGLPADPRLA